MLFTHEGLTDGSLDPSMFLTIPAGLKWPAPLKKLTEDLAEAFNAWSSAEVTQIEATTAWDASEALDAALLVTALNAGEGDPGTPNQVATKRACVVAEARARLSAKNYNEAVVELLTALPGHADDLIKQAVKIERKIVADHVAAMLAAEEVVRAAERSIRDLGQVLNFFTENLNLGAENRIEPEVDQVGWPAPYRYTQARSIGVLDKLAGTGETPAPVLGSMPKRRA